MLKPADFTITNDPTAILSPRTMAIKAFWKNPKDLNARRELVDILLENGEDELAASVMAGIAHIGDFLSDEQLRDRIEELLVHLKNLNDANADSENIPFLKRNRYVAKYNRRWVKIIVIVSDDHLSRYVWGFVALARHGTKNLGKIYRGDIHKPACWDSPSRHARGNVADGFNFGGNDDEDGDLVLA